MKKNAFNLVELLIVFIIIGIILVAQMLIMKEKINQYTAPYYTTYNALKKAVYNVLSDPFCPSETLVDKDGDPLCPDFAREFPRDSKQLCKRLVEFINVPTGDNCDTAGGIDHITRPKDFNDKNVQFQTSNGVKYYISDSLYTVEDIKGTVTEFFVVYADLNGNNGPNRFHCEEGNEILPDIVPFAVTRRGHVVPIGLPARSKVYMSASVRFPGEIDKSNISVQANSKTKSLTFNEALLNAWPGSLKKLNGNPTTTIYRYENTPDTLLYDVFGRHDGMGETTFSYLGYRTCIPNPESDPLTEKVRESASTPTPIDINDLREIDKDTGCQGGNYTCRVTVDSYQTSRW